MALSRSSISADKNQIIGAMRTATNDNDEGIGGSSTPIWSDSGTYGCSISTGVGSLTLEIRGRVAIITPNGAGREFVTAHEVNHNLDRDPDGTWGRHASDWKDTDDDGKCDDTGTYGCNACGGDPDWPHANDGIQEVGFDTTLPWDDDPSVEETALSESYPDLMS